tara:strand:- start:114 stop:416 length:303 start_codon:yes stop_codon:yes gene_type:complete
MEITPEQQADIINQWIRNKRRRQERKDTYVKPSNEQRKQWNKNYYEKNKMSAKETNKENYETNKEQAKERAKFYYYKKNNNLDTLKTRYPDIYDKFLSPE